MPPEPPPPDLVILDEVDWLPDATWEALLASFRLQQQRCTSKNGKLQRAPR